MKRKKIEMKWVLLIIINVLGFWTIIIPFLTLCWLLSDWGRLSDKK